MNQLSCGIIGKGSFAASCIKLIQEKNFQIKFIVSDCDFIGRLAKAKNLPLLSYDELLSQQRETEIDLLFSISNELYLSAELIKSPRLFAANFHPSLLPKYAGMKSASWALIKNENLFGCTWHVMNEILDGGDILKQVEFPIAADETAMSLTLKSYQHGLVLFAELLNDILANEVKLTQQDMKLRTFFSNKDFTAELRVINWHQSAQEIVKIARACYNGKSVDIHFSQRLLYNSAEYIIRELSSLDSSTGQPGTIVSIQENSFIVATYTSDVLIKEIYTTTGLPLSITEFVSMASLKEGLSFNNKSGEVMQCSL